MNSTNWVRLGWYDLILAYRRTFIGPFWQSIQLAVWAAGLAFVFRPLYGGTDYILYLIAGLSVWNFLSNCVTMGSTVFVSNAGLILNLPTGPMAHILRLWTNISLRFLFQLLVFVPAVILVGGVGEVLFGWAFVSLAYLLLLGLPLITVVAFVNTYLRDVEHFISIAMRFLFFMTPIFWIPTEDRIQALMVEFNPFYYPLEIARAPLLGDLPEAWVWGVGLVGLLVILLIAQVLIMTFSKRIAAWL